MHDSLPSPPPFHFPHVSLYSLSRIITFLTFLILTVNIEPIHFVTGLENNFNSINITQNITLRDIKGERRVRRQDRHRWNIVLSGC